MMIRRFFEIVTRRGGANPVSLRSLPQIERARVITLFEEAKQLNSNSSPEKLQEMMGKLGNSSAMILNCHG